MKRIGTLVVIHIAGLLLITSAYIIFLPGDPKPGTATVQRRHISFMNSLEHRTIIFTSSAFIRGSTPKVWDHLKMITPSLDSQLFSLTRMHGDPQRKLQ